MTGFLPEWKEVFPGGWMLKMIEEGWRFNLFKEPCVDRNVKKEYYLSKKEQESVETFMKQMLQTEVIEKVTEGQDTEFYSPIFIAVQEKKERFILNAKNLNLFIKKFHFKMEGLHHVAEIIQRGDFMCKIDLSKAFFHIPIHKQHRKYLNFYWKGNLYRFTCLPFGVTSAPRVFTKLLRSVMGVLRRKGIILVVYIDDILVIAATMKKCRSDTQEVIRLLEKLGFMINVKKSETNPTRKLKFLGIIIDTLKFQFIVGQKKLNKMKSLATGLLVREFVSIRNLAGFIGYVGFLKVAIPRQRWMTRRLMESKNLGLQLYNNWDAKIILSQGARQQLKWWYNFTEDWNGKIIIRAPTGYDIKITTDASPTGWGAMMNSIRARGYWSKEEALLHQNVRELNAVSLATRAYLKNKDISDQTILIVSDNSTTVKYINAQGGKKENLAWITLQLIEWLEEKKMTTIFATHKPGITMGIVDTLSRVKVDTSAWQVSEEVFGRIQSIWGLHDVDLFATRLSNKVRKYYSWFPDPYALATDALRHSWKGFKNPYACPPICLITKVLNKVIAEKLTLTLVAPNWETQVWYPLLLSLIIEQPVPLYQYNKVIYHQDPKQNISSIATNLFAFRVSAKY